jgi:ribose transport system permease protein
MEETAMSADSELVAAVASQPTTRARRVTSHGLLELLGRYGLPLLLVVVVVLFSALKPASFGSWDTFKATFSTQSTIIIIAFAAMMPLIVGEFDLSVGSNAGLASVLVVGFCVKSGLSPYVSFVLVALICTLIGLFNGLLVVGLKVNSFVATLGMATLLEGVAQWYTGQDVITGAPETLSNIARDSAGPLPVNLVYALVLGAILILVLQFSGVGRKLTAVGANRRAAHLTGIHANRYIVAAFGAGGLLAGLAGALLGAAVGTVQAGLGSAFLLPAFAAVFLGATSFSPGRYNVPGTVVAVLLLAFTVSGLIILGVEPWIQPIVNGGGLIAAVALSSWALRARTSRLRRQQLQLIARADQPTQNRSEQHTEHVTPISNAS